MYDYGFTTLYDALLDHHSNFTSIRNIHVYFRILDSMSLRHITHALPNLCCSRVSNLCCACIDDLNVWVKLHRVR
jgi:hypothetical protein